MSDYQQRFIGENMEKIQVLIAFSAQGESDVQLCCPFVIPFHRKAEGVWACNQLNKEYRWIKFIINEESVVEAYMDVICHPETFETDCMGYVEQFIALLDQCYTTLEDIDY